MNRLDDKNGLMRQLLRGAEVKKEKLSKAQWNTFMALYNEAVKALDFAVATVQHYKKNIDSAKGFAQSFNYTRAIEELEKALQNVQQLKADCSTL